MAKPNFYYVFIYIDNPPDAYAEVRDSAYTLLGTLTTKAQLNNIPHALKILGFTKVASDTIMVHSMPDASLNYAGQQKDG